VLSVYGEIENGREAMLLAQIQKLSLAFDECESNRDLKALSVELRAAIAEYEEIKAPEKAKDGAPKTGVDELRARREQKLKARGAV